MEKDFNMNLPYELNIPVITISDIREIRNNYKIYFFKFVLYMKKIFRYLDIIFILNLKKKMCFYKEDNFTFKQF